MLLPRGSEMLPTHEIATWKHVEVHKIAPLVALPRGNKYTPSILVALLLFVSTRLNQHGYNITFTTE